MSAAARRADEIRCAGVEDGETAMSTGTRQGAPPFDLCERTFQFALRVVRLCQQLERTAGISRNLSSQLFRSGTSVGANVEEGQAGQSRPDLISKYMIARKEARETRYWLRLLQSSELLDGADLGTLIAEASELIGILTAILKKVQQTANG
jgi:four helix bundle protein